MIAFNCEGRCGDYEVPKLNPNGGITFDEYLESVRVALLEFTHGPAHTHRCGWCGGDILCVNGRDCEVRDGEMHCTLACYRHEGEEGRAVGNRVGN